MFQIHILVDQHTCYSTTQLKPNPSPRRKKSVGYIVASVLGNDQCRVYRGLHIQKDLTLRFNIHVICKQA